MSDNKETVIASMIESLQLKIDTLGAQADTLHNMQSEIKKEHNLADDENEKVQGIIVRIEQQIDTLIQQIRYYELLIESLNSTEYTMDCPHCIRQAITIHLEHAQALTDRLLYVTAGVRHTEH